MTKSEGFSATEYARVHKPLGPKALAAAISAHPAFPAHGGLSAHYRTARSEPVMLRMQAWPGGHPSGVELVYMTTAQARVFLVMSGAAE